MSVQLPKMNMPDRVERGRNAYEGYQRGWGLQFGQLFEALKKDEIFLRAGRLAQSRSIVAPVNLANIYLIVRFFLGRLASQDIVEFGSFRGGSAFFMAQCLKEFFPDARVYALDTFDGMPDTAAIDWHKRGDFGRADLHEVRAAAKLAGLDNLIFEKGLFQATFSDRRQQRCRIRPGPHRLRHFFLGPLLPECGMAEDVQGRLSRL